MPSPHYTTAKRQEPGPKTWPLSIGADSHSLRPKVVKQQAEVCLCPDLPNQFDPGGDPRHRPIEKKYRTSSESCSISF
jgi:hypothetical protein